MNNFTSISMYPLDDTYSNENNYINGYIGSKDIWIIILVILLFLLLNYTISFNEDFQDMSKKNKELVADLKALEDEYEKVSDELDELQTEHHLLSTEFEELTDDYDNLNTIYHNLSDEMKLD